MQTQIKNLIKSALQNLGIEDGGFAVEHPEDFKNGDYSTNVAMAHAKKLSMNPRELAEKISLELEKNKIKEIEKIEIAGPGFINFYLTAEFFATQTAEIFASGKNFGQNSTLSGKKVMVEYTQPNPFKPFHIGHLMSNAIGESLSRIVEFSGAKTIRANYQGDVGPHVAKAIYGLMQNPIPASITKAS
jgi:arginyl-tRNA synthetase